jgi:hypothetical protein
MPGKKKLPTKILHIPNQDKAFHEKWIKGDDILNFPHPFRIILASAGPNKGKTNTIKNIIIRQEPQFDQIFLIHCAVSSTREYEDLDVLTLKEIPDPNDDSVFDVEKKNLLILEDIAYDNLTKKQKSNLDRSLGYVSTHKNLSIMATCQDFFAIPPSMRKLVNVYIIWKADDLDSLEIIRRRVGIPKKKWDYIFETLIKDEDDGKEIPDSFWIDNTRNSPAKYRINGYDIVKINDYKL